MNRAVRRNAYGMFLVAALLFFVGCYKWKYKCSSNTDCKEGDFCNHGLCISLDTISCENVDCNDDGVCADERCPTIPKINPVAFSSTKDVALSGNAQPNFLVTVYEAGLAISSATANNDGIWNITVSLAEGAHLLTARASNSLGISSPASQPVTVEVDLTSPTVVKRMPLPKSENVCARAPITIFFSEPIKPETVTDSVVVSSTKVETIDKTLVLSKDGKSLVIKPTTRLDYPDELTVKLTNQLTDLAGNRLLLPENEWKWSVPEWVDLGIADWSYFGHDECSSIWSKVIAVGPACEVVVGSRHVMGPKSTIFFHWWDGSSWSKIGRSTGDIADSMSVDIDGANQPVFAWREVLSGERYASIFVARWDGTKKILLGTTGSINDITRSASDPNIKLDSSGNPVLAWKEDVSNVKKIFVKKWNGSEWVSMGTTALNEGSGVAAGRPLITIHDGNLIRVSWSEDSDIKTRTWDGNNWHGYGWNFDLESESSYEFNISQNSTPFVLSHAPSSEKPYISTSVWKKDGVSWEFKFTEVIFPETNNDTPHLGTLPPDIPIITWKAGSEIYISSLFTRTNFKLSADGFFLPVPTQPIISTNPSGTLAIAFKFETRRMPVYPENIGVKLFNNTIQ